MPSSRRKVVIVGGGIGGLTAAHELIERDFDVVVYERRDEYGGKAASVRVDGLPADDEKRPGEHGFRFFPGWYRHLPDTMRRIPRRGHRDRGHDRTVFDHLVPTERNLLLQYERDPVPIVLRAPTTSSQAQALFAFIKQLAGIGLPVADVAFFFQTLARFLRTPAEQREREYDSKSWWSLLNANERSDAFRTLTIATTRTLLAAKAEKASAYTIATMAIRTLFDSPLSSDHVLDGPTSEVWIKPWVQYLEGRGVKFVSGFELESIEFDGKRPRITSLVFARSDDVLSLRLLREAQVTEDVRTARRNLTRIARRAESKAYDWSHKLGEAPLEALRNYALEALGQTEVSRVRAGEDADQYVFALPVEQMAYYVNRSTSMRSYDPSLKSIIKLSAAVDWMAGIQFYLKCPLDLPRGHIVCADSEWALTAIEQTQFWRDVALPESVQSILSADISAWDRKGRHTRKEAFLCTKDEIAREVWEQLKESLNRSGEQDVLRDTVLVGALEVSYHLDDNIVDRYDRKKQAAYAQGQNRALDHIETTAVEAAAQDGDASSELPLIFGDRLELNVEPLLVNRPGTLALRPDARTKISNMFLAADYVSTATNLACMEGANEAARLAVNAILEAVGSRYERCKTWRMEDGEILVRAAALLSFADRLPGARTSIEAATGAVTTLGALARRATDNVKNLWNKS